ncbi:bleomycin resistance protein [Sphingomonas sp. DT-204]|uniref:bleomycin resistance protein n=1 Tax=Sphingomonas sp. DT-204 TaxID=3396166 RepID=UPI003F1D3A59
MALIPIVRVTDMARAVEFYTRVLDFEHEGTWPAMTDPSYTVLRREGHELHLSSHAGDGVAGQAVGVLVGDVDALVGRLAARGLDQRHRSDSSVHCGPVDQSWGTREFYVDDPDGNSVRFIQR